jgi:hypothetical protein
MSFAFLYLPQRIKKRFNPAEIIKNLLNLPNLRAKKDTAIYFILSESPFLII